MSDTTFPFPSSSPASFLLSCSPPDLSNLSHKEDKQVLDTLLSYHTIMKTMLSISDTCIVQVCLLTTVTLSDIAYLRITCLFVVVNVPIIQEHLLVHYFVHCGFSKYEVYLCTISVLQVIYVAFLIVIPLSSHCHTSLVTLLSFWNLSYSLLSQPRQPRLCHSLRFRLLCHRTLQLFFF